MLNMKFKKENYQTLSSISISVGEVFFAAFVGGIFLVSLDLLKLYVLILELILSIIVWYLAIYFGGKGK